MRMLSIFAAVGLCVLAGSADAALLPAPKTPLGPKVNPKLPAAPVPTLPSAKAKPKAKPKPSSKPPTVVAKTHVSAVALGPIRGDTTCRRGDPDCNRCTDDVPGQFRRIATGHKTRKRKPWRFRWPRAYGPQATTGFDAFDEDSPLADAIALSEAHPQGFVHTNSARYPYAGSHSQHEAGKPGTIFIIEQLADGKKRLAYLHRTRTHHPSGVHVLGRYLLFGERPAGSPDLLRVVDLDRPGQRQDIAHEMPNAAADGLDASKLFGGGLGIARLVDGTYLLVSSHPGNRDGRARVHRFYRVTGDLSDPARLRIRFVREQTYANPASFGGTDRRYSENLSLVTECGTGDIYALHSTGDGDGPDGLIGGGYWRLSRLVVGTAGPELRPIDAYDVSQNTEDCHMRSAASAGLTWGGQLELLCHQYRKDPDPSAINPFQFNTTGDDAWNFVSEVPN